MSQPILCYGDSNTYGFDPRTNLGDRYPETGRWPELLGAALGRAVCNAGSPGRKIPYVTADVNGALDLLSSLKGQMSAAEGEAPLLCVMLGINDLLQNRPAAKAAQWMGHFLDALTPLFGAESLCLIAPPPVNYGSWVTSFVYRESRKLETAYRAVADYLGVHFVATSTWDIPTAFDGVHFSQEGHQRFAQMLAEEAVFG